MKTENIVFSRKTKWSKSDLENVRFWVTEMTLKRPLKWPPEGTPKSSISGQMWPKSMAHRIPISGSYILMVSNWLSVGRLNHFRHRARAKLSKNKNHIFSFLFFQTKIEIFTFSLFFWKNVTSSLRGIDLKPYISCVCTINVFLYVFQQICQILVNIVTCSYRQFAVMHIFTIFVLLLCKTPKIIDLFQNWWDMRLVLVKNSETINKNTKNYKNRKYSKICMFFAKTLDF